MKRIRIGLWEAAVVVGLLVGCGQWASSGNAGDDVPLYAFQNAVSRLWSYRDSNAAVVVNGDLSWQDPETGSTRAAYLMKFSNGIIAINDGQGDTFNLHLLLPGVTAAQARAWRELMLPIHLDGEEGGCTGEVRSGAIRGGAYLQAIGGC